LPPIINAVVEESDVARITLERYDGEALASELPLHDSGIGLEFEAIPSIVTPSNDGDRFTRSGAHVMERRYVAHDLIWRAAKRCE
jgi:hypothetical protein